MFDPHELPRSPRPCSQRVVLCGVGRVYRVDWLRDDAFMAEASVLRGINAYPREAGIVFESPAVMGDDSMISGTNRGPDWG